MRSGRWERRWERRWQRRWERRWVGAAVLALTLALGLAPGGCGDDGGGGGDPDADRDGGAADTLPSGDVPGPSDVPPVDVAGDVGSDAGGDPGGDAGGDGPFGFPIRVPGTHTLRCESFMGTTDEELPDRDWVCTFAHGGTEGVVYVQATPSECVPMGMSSGAVYTIPGAWMSVDGVVTPLEAADYDWGGNHQNDALDFTWQGTRYRYWHSSFGIGWHVCQPMDCLVVLAPGGQVVEDGCCDAQARRSLPAVCVEVAPDGSVPPLVDAFAPCQGEDPALCVTR